jgi:hypothetical protein
MLSTTLGRADGPRSPIDPTYESFRGGLDNLIGGASDRSRTGYPSCMTHIRARVVRGRLTLDEPTDLPEGTIVDLLVDDEADNLTAEEQQARNAAILRAFESAKMGKVRDAHEIIAELRRR